jgi:hypothetical protein
MNDGTPHDDHGCAAHEVRYLPDAPLGDDTEFVFIDRIAFVNAHKHEEVVAHHVAEVERLQEALTAARDIFKRFGYPVYADACDDALEGD